MMDLATRALRELADAAGAEVGALWASRDEGRAPELLAVRGLERSALQPELRAGHGLGGRALAEGRLVAGEHGGAGLRVEGLGGPVPVRQELHVPLRADGEVVGVAALGRLAAREDAEAERLALQARADAAGEALAELQVRRRAERQARLGRALLDASPDPVALVGPTGTVLAENAAMAALRAEGVDPLGAGGDEELAHGRQVLARHVAPVRDDDGTALGTLVLLRDVSAERGSERLKDEFVALVSHELRTPLTSIIGYLDLVLDEPFMSDDARRYLEVVERNAKRLLRLVGDLLFVAQAEAGRLAFDRGVVDLGQVASEAVEAARPTAEKGEVELALEAEPVRPLTGDRDRFAQLLDNLVSNAVKFTPPGGHVDVRVGEEGDHAVLEVRDTGVGVPTGEQDRLFQRFFRASTATNRGVPGAGLGLTVVKAIVDAHGGRIAVASEEGRGTTMRVVLPYVTPAGG
jgi:signal transduction histidine kinase